MYSKGTPAQQTKKCPVCSHTVNDSMLFVDLFTLKILKDAPTGVDEVTVNVEDKCSWTPLCKTINPEPLTMQGDTQRVTISSSPVLIIEEVETIDLTEDTTVYAEPWVDPIPVKPEPPIPRLSHSVTQPHQTASPRRPNLPTNQPSISSFFNGTRPTRTTTTLDLVTLPEPALDATDVYMLDLTISEEGPPATRTVPAKRGTSFVDAIELE